MTKNDDYSERYENEPCQIVIPGIPLIAESEDLTDCDQVRIRGVTTHKTSAKEALRLADAMLKPVRRQLKNGRCQELLKLLETRPEFIDHPWVREEVIKWLKTGRSFSKRGRRIGTFKRHPLIVAAVVQEIIKREWKSNKYPTFSWLEEQDWHNYETARKHYDRAMNEKRFRAVLIQNSIWSTPRPRLKARRLIRHAEHMHKGQSITRTLCDLPAGPVTVRFTAT